ncbi:PD40 domain-containing protein [Sandaracinus amylolyticus]|uniref:TolB protein n=1 Tax=Sandaracinus amylolyticus TaxID=927083 RepID=A0A0F6W0T2_9BACT|nr:PD40 domain-containing protein [Sandaracinus amylolyticus]AKF04593.1 tolB protein precursor [Sandaracinus amylolyticus]
MTLLSRHAQWLVPLALAFGACTERGGDPPDTSDGGNEVVSLELDPAEVELTSGDGSTPTVTLRAFARTVQGERVEVSPESWTLAHDRIGSIDEHGTFTASGRAGGEVQVTARVPGVIAPVVGHATIRVRLTLSVPLDPMVPPTLPERFDTLPEVEEPFESPALLYPLEGARMPNNVGAPELQWEPFAQAGDAFRVVIETPHATVRAYTYDDGRTFRASYPIDRNTWRVVADSALGEEITIRVDRIPSGGSEVVRGTPVTIWLSEDGVFGTVYYWQVRVDPQGSDVLRLDAASGTRQSVFGTESGGCVGCHALSHDGRQLSATLDSRGVQWTTAVVDTTSASAPPPDVMGPFTPAYHFMAFSPDATRILASRPLAPATRDVTALFLLDGATGAEMAASGLPTGQAGYPTWSPDGARVAWMDGGSDGPSGTRSPTRIVVSDVAEGDAFGEARVVHDGASLASAPEGGSTDSRPTWSPDSRFLAFAHGTSSVSSVQFDGEPPTASLYLVSRDGGTPIRLVRGMGDGGPVDAFWPVFSPFVTEERDGSRLFWLAFYSRQDFGNARAGTAGTSRRQLWVMAIDPAAAERGEDPSSPPYWLTGQDTRADDIAALWAPTSCRGRDESCSTSSECCSGECAAADPSMPDVLTCRPPTVCRRSGDSCEDASDCCDGLECNLGVCGYVPPI